MKENSSIEVDRVARLLRAAIEISDNTPDFGERRTALLKHLSEALDAASGHWVAYRGNPDTETAVPIAFIPFGYTEPQMTSLSQFMMDSKVQKELYDALQDLIRRVPRNDKGWSVVISISLPHWIADPTHWLPHWMAKIGVSDWMQAGRYLPGNIGCVVTLCRAPDKPPFSSADQLLLDVAFSNIPWLWVSSRETVPQAMIESLTPRQRAVLHLLLDGCGRKQIASRLEISQDTVGDHTKVIYERFGVNSAIELAALFLRNA